MSRITINLHLKDSDGKIYSASSWVKDLSCTSFMLDILPSPRSYYSIPPIPPSPPPLLAWPLIHWTIDFHLFTGSSFSGSSPKWKRKSTLLLSRLLSLTRQSVSGSDASDYQGKLMSRWETRNHRFSNIILKNALLSTFYSTLPCNNLIFENGNALKTHVNSQTASYR